MFIHPINKQDCLSHKGLYFVKLNNVVFNPKYTFLTKRGMKASDNGFLYYEANEISQAIKDKFKNSEFIQNLSKTKNDVFVWFTKIHNKQHENETYSYISLAKISWANLNQPVAQERLVIGESNFSQNQATEDMFIKLKNQAFENRQI